MKKSVTTSQNLTMVNQNITECYNLIMQSQTIEPKFLEKELDQYDQKIIEGALNTRTTDSFPLLTTLTIQLNDERPGCTTRR